MRAALSYAKMLRSRDQRREAHELLDAMVGRITEGGETIELGEARELLSM